MANSVTKPSYYLREYNLSGGLEQGTNPFAVDSNTYLYLKNVTHDENGSLSKDGGYSIFLTQMHATETVDLIHDYVNLAGTHLILTSVSGNLYKASGSPLAWNSVASSVFTKGYKISAVNFLDRCYMASSTQDVNYTSGTSVTAITTDNGSANVRGRYLEVLGNSLFLAGMASVYARNQVVYSLPGSHVFYNVNETDHDTYATSSQTITIDGTITGIKAFQGLLFIFTNEDVWTWNPSTYETKVLARTGCVSNDTIKEIDGILYWASRDGVYKYDGSTLPSLISLPITNWATNSLWRLINGSNWADLNAGVLDGRYYLWVGTLTAALPGDASALSDVVLVYDTYRGTWTFNDGTPSRQMASVINASGDKRLLIGSNATGTTYQKDYSYTHDTAAFDAVIRTRWIYFDLPEGEKQIDDFFAAYRPEGESAKYLTVSIATNGVNTYTEKIADDTSMKLPLDGTETDEFQFERVSLGGTRARTISYEFKNGDAGVNITLLGFTQEFKYIGSNIMNIST